MKVRPGTALYSRLLGPRDTAGGLGSLCTGLPGLQTHVQKLLTTNSEVDIVFYINNQLWGGYCLLCQVINALLLFKTMHFR